MVPITISIHVPREGDDVRPKAPRAASPISIHVPREGDDVPGFDGGADGKISIHVPREGDDIRESRRTKSRWDFNPRPP